jgi:hypothetical protein
MAMESSRRRGAQIGKSAEDGRKFRRSEARRMVGALLFVLLALLVLGMKVGFRTPIFIGAEVVAIAFVLIACSRHR